MADRRGQEFTEADFASARRIRDCLIRHGPLREQELRNRTGLDSIGAYYPYLREEFGIGRLHAWQHWPDDDDKMYFLPGHVDPSWKPRP